MKHFALTSFTLIVACLVNFTLAYFGWDSTSQSYMYYVYAGTALFGILLATFIKLSNEHLRTINRVIRFGVALMISSYGFAKVLKTQFTVSADIYETPIGDLNGFYLTWFYFGYSYVFALIIAVGQIGGSVLLLFERTRLLGATLLIPIMLNIVFVNLFYGIAIGALLNSLIFTTCLIYLLLLNYSDLKNIFLPKAPKHTYSFKALLVKNLMRAIPIALGFFNIYYIIVEFELDQEPPIKGTFEMSQITKNGLPEKPFLTDSVLTKVFFHSGKGDAEIEFNSPSKRHRTSYNFSESTNSITIKVDKDSLQGSIADKSKLELSGIVHNDTVSILLKRKR